MIALFQVVLVALFLVGDGHCQKNLSKEIDDHLFGLSYILYEVLELLPEAVVPVSGGVVTSPLNAISPVGLLEMFTNGLAKRQLDQFLNLTPLQLLNISPYRVQKKGDDNVRNNVFMSLSKTFIQTGLNFSSKFIDIVDKGVGGETGHINFRFPEAAAEAINDWASARTAGAVRDVTDPRWITNDTEIFMVNVLVFKGTWKYQFKEETTLKMFSGDTPKNFKVLKYMSQMDEMEYVRSSELNADIVRLPFSDEDFDFILINPAEFQFDYVLNVTKKLRERPELVEEALERSSPRLVELSLPQVTISSVIDLKEVLKALGVTNIFDSRLANLQEMFQDGHKGHISSMMQKVEIVLDSKGLAAVNGRIPDADAMLLDNIEDMKAIEVHATRPFVFQIRYRGYPLFLGSYEGLDRV